MSRPLGAPTLDSSSGPSAREPVVVWGAGGELPLRLVLAQGSVGLEITRPISFLGATIDSLLVTLPGVKFPFDLSRGVKEFRNYRSRLQSLRLRLDVEQLVQSLSAVTETCLGFKTKQNRVEVHQHEQGLPSVSVSCIGEDAGIAFELLLMSGRQPRLILSGCRGFGLKEPPLALSLRLLDAWTFDLTTLFDGCERQGRTLDVGNFLPWLCLEILPSLGCRLPSVDGLVIESARKDGGDLVLEFAVGAEPALASGDALRLFGLSQLVRSADDGLAAGELLEAQRLYALALEKAPGHPMILSELAALDCSKERPLSACSFLEEAKSSSPLVESSVDEEAKGAAAPVISLAERLALMSLEVDAMRRAGLASLQDIRREYSELEFERGLRALHLLSEVEELPDGSKSAPVDRAGEQTTRFHPKLEQDLVEPEPVAPELLEPELLEPELLEQRLEQAADLAPFLRKPLRWLFLEVLRRQDLQRARLYSERLLALAEQEERGLEELLFVGRAWADASCYEDARRWAVTALKRTIPGDGFEAQLGLLFAAIDEPARAMELLLSFFESSSVSEQLKEDELRLPPSIQISEEIFREAQFSLAFLELHFTQQKAQALARLRKVPSRGRWGARARTLEIKLLISEASPAAAAVSQRRLIEAVELEWIAPADAHEALSQIAADRELGALAQRAQALLSAPGKENQEEG
ncbi:MAG: hypothetical protein MK135_14645 [Polyangiaceae bacterium]|nr:hypothetical protein [Polyangiaceae bacterium]